MSNNTKQSRIIETQNGPVQGKTFTFEDNREATAFLGIPFGKPPVGELRFKKPVPADKWTEVKQCTEFSPAFPYISIIPGKEIIVSEDALYLNVFVPEAKQGEKPPTNLPVFCYIHGGGFIMDSTSWSGDEGICRYLCSKGVIVVTPNYRLGIFGFLTLGNEEVKGNYGMWDMALALKWTKDNISAFGGDPNKITVGGQSAGGAATDFLTLSPHTRDLFNQAIIFAGTSFCPWLSTDADHSRKVLIEYAKHLGATIDGKTTEEINKQTLDFYKSHDANKLAIALAPNPEFKFYPDIIFPIGPWVDGDFFPKSFEELRKESSKKVILNGVTEYEGLLFATIKAFQPDMTHEQCVCQTLQGVRPDLSPELNHKLVTQAIGKTGEPESKEHIVRCMEVISDFEFNDPALEFAESKTENGSQVYNFIFSYYRKGSLGPLAAILPFEGATHCMELPYLFGKSILSEFEVQEEDSVVMDRFVTMLTNFIKTGCPNDPKYEEKWESFKPGQGDPYFLFGQNEFGMRKGFAGGDRSRFWTKVHKEHPLKNWL